MAMGYFDVPPQIAMRKAMHNIH